MKCPILSAPTARTAFTEHFADVDCLKEECAWWDKPVQRCLLQNISEKMSFIYLELNDMAKHMPHAGQFTR